MNRPPAPLPVVLATIMATSAVSADTVQLITLDPGHFHAALVHNTMYEQVSPVVRVYAPSGAELDAHVNRVEGFNTRAENPTHWDLQVVTGNDFLERMCHDRAGNVVVISGNNLRKTEYIQRSVEAGFNVLADKPMAITPEGFHQLCEAFATAAQKKVLLYDIMTERFEINSMLQRELAHMPELFGNLEPGTLENPGVVMANVHHYLKTVAGKPLIRPAWFFDVRQQGEAIPDVGTHLVDLVQWECFPGRVLDWRKDVRVHSARIWSTPITLAQFERVTGQKEFPGFLSSEVDTNKVLQARQNGEVNYTVCGIHVKVTALWKFEAPPGAKDTHYSLVRGSKANLVIRQEAAQNYMPTLSIESHSGKASASFEKAVRSAVAKLAKTWPGLDVRSAGGGWELVVPEKYNVGHEAHFAQVTQKYLHFLADGKMPRWETAGMLAKYFVTTEAYRLSR